MNSNDYTFEFDPADIQQNKGISILSYIGILVLIPFFARQNSRFARFHVNQGMVLFLTTLVLNFIGGIVARIPLIRIISPVFRLLDVGLLVLMIIGILNVMNGRAKDLPVIGSLRLLNY